MGVMGCFRNNCENIMCDTYINGIGYICGECQRQFKDFLHSKGINSMSESIMHKELKLFMATEKDPYSNHEIMSVDQFFKEHTK